MYVLNELKEGLKFCLRDKDVRCFESCYDDSQFCETVVFLGYPEDKTKYVGMFEIVGIFADETCFDDDTLEYSEDDEVISIGDFDLEF